MMSETCAICGVKKYFPGEGGYTAKDARSDFLHRDRDLKQKQVWVHSWLCYEAYRERMAEKFRLKILRKDWEEEKRRAESE